jgi:ankyrin repeat protein
MSAAPQDKLINTIRHGDIQGVEALLTSGADVNAAGSTGSTPLTQAAEMGNLAVARLLLEKAADVSHPNRRGNTPLHIAVDASIDEIIQDAGKQGDELTEMIELLLEHGASPAIRNPRGKTPLDLAAEYRAQKIVNLLKSWPGTKPQPDAPPNAAPPHR